MNQIRVKIENKRQVSERAIEFKLISASDASLPATSPGAHIDVHIGNELVRQYSLINGPSEEDCYYITVQLEEQGRGGSKAIHETFEVGSEIEISQPRNCFELSESAEHHLLLAGGIGITPLLSMAKSLKSQNASFELHYCCKDIEKSAYAQELVHSDLSENVRVHTSLNPANKRIEWESILGSQKAGTHVYMCGPEGFLENAESVARKFLPSDAIHKEYFSVSSDSLDAGENTSFMVYLNKKGISILVPDDKTLAEALNAHGAEIPLGCAQGLCGACMTQVYQGEPDHRDQYLTDEERESNQWIMPCCSRSKSAELILEL